MKMQLDLTPVAGKSELLMLVKIVSRRGGAGEEKRFDDSRFDGDDTVLILQNASDHEK